MNNNDLIKGKQGEDFFRSSSAFSFFYENASAHDPETGEYVSIHDLRSRRKEGEFALHDGSLIEVKSDYHCYETGNIIVELTGRYSEDGWFNYCIKNGVKYLVWNLFRNESKRYPYRSILLDFKLFESYIYRLMEDEQYMKKHLIEKPDYDGSVFKILKVNIEEVISCSALAIADTQVSVPGMFASL